MINVNIFDLCQNNHGFAVYCAIESASETIPTKKMNWKTHIQTDKREINGVWKVHETLNICIHTELQFPVDKKKEEEKQTVKNPAWNTNNTKQYKSTIDFSDFIVLILEF